MKAKIDLNYCSVQPGICKPMKECPNQAILYIEDKNAMLGAHMEVYEIVCKGCGTCIPICCGNAIALIN
jgi:NAD-dependent dihydropyrimidine dehydrogenase PreA subunit